MTGNGDRPPFMFTADDGLRMARITRACRDEDWGAVVRLVVDFYDDPARVDRMPRTLLLFHIGMLASALGQAAGEPVGD